MTILEFPGQLRVGRLVVGPPKTEEPPMRTMGCAVAAQAHAIIRAVRSWTKAVQQTIEGPRWLRDRLLRLANGDGKAVFDEDDWLLGRRWYRLHLNLSLVGHG